MNYNNLQLKLSLGLFTLVTITSGTITICEIALFQYNNNYSFSKSSLLNYVIVSFYWCLLCYSTLPLFLLPFTPQLTPL